jgi:hypothetical protein
MLFKPKKAIKAAIATAVSLRLADVTRILFLPSEDENL